MLKFTIAVPAYKASFFRDCIKSILLQSYNEFELIILNDKSPENLSEIVAEFHDDRIKYFENDTNVGAIDVVNNWNKCLALAKGEFIICMGDDDLLLPNCLEEYLNLMDKYPDLDIYHGWTEIIDENSKFLRLQEARPEFESVYSMMWHRWNGRLQFIGDFLFRTEALRFLGGYYKLPLAWASDDITSYILAEQKGIANTQMPVFQYRVNSRTISLTGDVSQKMMALQIEEDWYIGFFNKKTSNGLDYMFKKMLIAEFTSHFVKKRLIEIKSDFISKKSFNKVIFWLIKGKAFKVSTLMVIKAYLDSYVNKYAKR